MPKIHWFSLRDHLWRNGFSMNLWRRCPNKLTTSSSQCSAFEEPEMYAIPPPIPGRAQLFKHKKTCSWQVLPSALDNLVNFQQARLSLTPMYRWLGTWKVRRIRFTPWGSTKVKRIYFTHVWRGMLWKYSSLLPYQFEAAKSIRFISEKIQVHIPSSVSCFLIRQSALQVGRVGLSIFRFESCVCLSVSVSGCLYPSVCLKKSVKRSVPRLSYHIIPMIHTLVSQSSMPSGSSNLGGCLQGFSLRAHPTHMWTSPSLPGLYPPKVCSQWTSNRIFPPRIFCYCSNPPPVNTVQSPWFILSFMSFLYTSRVSATSSLTGGLNSLKLSPFARFLNFIPPAPDSSNRHHVCWSLWSSVLNPKSHLSITLPIPKTRNPHETSSQWPF